MNFKRYTAFVAIVLGGLFPLVVTAQNAAVTVTVDANASRHPINPEIYGVAFASSAQLNDLNSPLNRSGGNAQSRYNWQINASNRAADWYFESIGEASSVAGEQGDTFITASRAGNAEPMLTIPMLDWVAKLGSNRSKLASFSISKYGTQTGSDAQWFPDAGNGVLTNGQNVVNTPADAHVASTSTFQQEWMQYLVSRWGSSGNGGLKYYVLDNEPSIWFSTHRDVHPVGPTMDEIRDRTLDYSAKIKATDPNARVVGPEEWGWSGYTLSGYDQQYGNLHGWSNLPDRTNHGGWDYLPWLLDQLRQNNVATGKRLLDVFSVHYYPQGGEFSNDVSTTMQQRRNRSTRSLWDPNYVDETWINDKVQLVRRLKSWVTTYYPGTLIGLTEYNWGAESHINGATTQADVLGIFGREGLDMATRWTTPDATTPTYKAMKLYRNYDGSKLGMGDVSVSAIAPNPDTLSAFAGQRTSDGALTVMVISKFLSGSTPTTLNLSNFAHAGNAQLWQLTSANTITHLANISITGNSLTATLPAQSITLFVLAAASGNIAPTAFASASPSSGVAPLPVQFNGSGSSDSDGSIASYAWTFGDGASATGVTPSHTYANPGSYSAQLTVTDNQGATGAKSVTITALSNAPIAPAALSASVNSATQISLAWTDKSSNETGFQIERCKNSGCTNFALIASVGANITNYANTGLVKGTSYSYRVRAINGSGNSAYSNTASAKTLRR